MENQITDHRIDKRFKHFTFYKGFDSLQEAKEDLKKIGFETCEGFVFIKVTYHSKTYIYPVIMENLALQIIITKAKCWYRNRIPDYPYYRYHHYKNIERKKDKKQRFIRLFDNIEEYDKYVQFCDEIFIGTLINYNSLQMNEYELIAETIGGLCPRISNKWNDDFKKEMEKKCDVECIYIGNDIEKPNYIVFDSIILLSTLFFGQIGKYMAYSS